jgi:hypothetical protein
MFPVFFFLVMCDLFNHAVSSCDCMASNAVVINEWRIGKNTDGRRSWPSVSCLDTLLDGWKTKKINQAFRCPGRGLYWASPGYRSHVLSISWIQVSCTQHLLIQVSCTNELAQIFSYLNLLACAIYTLCVNLMFILLLNFTFATLLKFDPSWWLRCG